MPIEEIKTGTVDNEFLTALKSKLLGTEGVVSSQETELDKTISGVVTGLETAQKKREAGVTAGFERGRIEARKGALDILETTREKAQFLGGASQFAILRRIEESTEKSLRDLDLREQEALATGQMETATAIANLKVQQLQFQITQRQQLFSNLISTATLEQQVRQPVIDLMGKYPDAQISPSDSAEVATDKIRKSKSYQLNISKAEADIALVKAQAQKALTRGVLSNSQINRYALIGIPADVADGIQRDLNTGFNLEAIRSNLATQFGKEKGFWYLDQFMVESEKTKEDALIKLLRGKMSEEEGGG